MECCPLDCCRWVVNKILWLEAQTRKGRSFGCVQSFNSVQELFTNFLSLQRRNEDDLEMLASAGSPVDKYAAIDSQRSSGLLRADVYRFRSLGLYGLQCPDNPLFVPFDFVCLFR